MDDEIEKGVHGVRDEIEKGVHGVRDEKEKGVRYELEKGVRVVG